MSDFQDISVKVPIDRLAEFYEWFGTWLASPEVSPRVHEIAARRYPWNPTEDLELAVRAWIVFPERARLLLSTLIDNPDRRYWGERLAEMHNIPNGRYGVAGSLAWPGRTLRKLGRPLPIESEPDDRGGSAYWMTPAMARLFNEARGKSGIDGDVYPA